VERPDEARFQIERALELDPLNTLVRVGNGFLLFNERRYAESIEEYEAVLRIEPDNPLGHGNLGALYHLTGNYDAALEMVRRSFPGDQELDDALDRGYAEGGYRAALVRYAETLAARPGAAERLSWDIACRYAWAGDRERTLNWLEVAYQARVPLLVFINSPELDLVRDDPRYQDLRRRMGLAQ
jgi:tetratricopeptide (TPR) repeat protein